MKLNRKWIMVLALVMSMVMATGGTLAYLTDRDSEANVFTIGNVEIDLTEDFEQDSALVPGVDIEKKPVITNTGKTDAWVWLEFSIPTALDNFIQGTEQGSNENVIHWNPMGATTEGYVTADRVSKAFADGLLTADMFPAGVTNYTDYITANDMTWNVFNSIGEGENAYQVEIEGVPYNTYVLLYNKALEPGETTLPNIYKVFLDAGVDIDPEGNLNKVVAGEVIKLDWNINDDGAPIIYASAYAIQKDGFETVEEAYAAYTKQWTTEDGVNNGLEYGENDGVTDSDLPVIPDVTVSTSKELADAIAAVEKGESSVIELEAGEYTTNLKIAGGTDIVITGDKNTVLKGQIASTSSEPGTLTLKGVTVKVDNSIVDSTGISQTSKSAIALWGTQSVVCEDVTFDMSLNDSSAISAWWDTGIGTSITVKNCTFNCNGQRPIRATGHVTVENCTFNDPYRYAVQLTAKTSTATQMDKAIINFKNNTIVNGENGKAYVYGIQLEGETYGCQDLVINGSGNTIVDGGADSTMYYCECGLVDHATIEWNTETAAVHAE